MKVRIVVDVPTEIGGIKVTIPAGTQGEVYETFTRPPSATVIAQVANNRTIPVRVPTSCYIKI